MEYKIGNEARCAVIGYGSWATAIVGLLTANETRVGWYVRNPEVLEGLLTEGRNPRYLSDMEFDRDRIAPSDDLDGIVREADILILATPSAYLKTPQSRTQNRANFHPSFPILHSSLLPILGRNHVRRQNLYSVSLFH